MLKVKNKDKLSAKRKGSGLASSSESIKSGSASRSVTDQKPSTNEAIEPRVENTPESRTSTEETSSVRSRDRKDVADVSMASSAEMTESGEEAEEDCPVECTGHNHLETLIVDEVVQFPVDTLYKMLFTSHSFGRRFMNANKSTGLEMTDWSDPDSKGDKFRMKKYTISIRGMGPKTGSTTEKQILRHYSTPGSYYVIDTEAQTGGIPYGDSFYLLTRFCLTRNTRYTSRLRVTCSTVHTKKVWGVIKGFIDKNVESGSKDSYGLMVRMLHEDAKKVIRRRTSGIRQRRRKLMKMCSVHHKVKEHRRSGEGDTRKSHQHNNNTSNNNNGSNNNHAISKDVNKTHTSATFTIVLTADSILKYAIILFAILLLINIVLYLKLMIIQKRADVLAKSRMAFFSDRIPDTAGGWKDIIADQKEFHRAETERWRDILSASGRILEEMRKTLAMLEHGAIAKMSPEIKESGLSGVHIAEPRT